ncbi:MAG: nuclear transport factor 2 family protein [Gemmatimonadota bacterium]
MTYAFRLSIFLACAAAWGRPVHAQEAIDVAHQLLAAFNAHDPTAMAELVTDDFELFYLDQEGRAGLAITGPEALRTEMAAYFEALPDVRSEVAGAIPGTRYVAFRERIVGGQSSLAVYEIEGAFVRRAWYYPAESGPGG